MTDNIEIVKQYFTLTPEQERQFDVLGEAYPEWNAKINVISRKDIDNLWINHILHSLAVAKFFHPVPGTTILDMGTGGGFPGIPLAIMWPDCRFHLVDRIGKKLRVGADIASRAGLTNVTFQHGDIGECREKFDFVVSRAVMRLDELVPLVRKNIAQQQHNAIPNGVIALKGGDLQSELQGVRYPKMIESIYQWFPLPFFQTKELVYVQLS